MSFSNFLSSFMFLTSFSSLTGCDCVSSYICEFCCYKGKNNFSLSLKVFVFLLLSFAKSMGWGSREFHFIFVIFIVVSFLCVVLSLLQEKIEIENTLKILLQCRRRQRWVSFPSSPHSPGCRCYWIFGCRNFSARSIVPQTLLFLSNIVIEVATLSASLDTTTIARVDLIIVYWIAVIRLSFAILQPTRIPAYAKLQWTNAGRPYSWNIVTTWHRRWWLMLNMREGRHSRF